MSQDTWSRAQEASRRAGWLGWALLALTLLALAAITYADRDGHIAQWHLEYAGGGSGKFRSPEGKLVANVLLFTLWAHVTAPLAALFLFVGIGGARRTSARIAMSVACATAIGALVWLLRLGAFGVALGIAPSR